MIAIKNDSFFQYLAENKNKDLIELICPMCYGEFLKYKHYIQSKFGSSKNNKYIFCSKSCSNTFKEKKINVVCKNCSKNFLKKQNQINKTKNNNFCSHSCSASFNNKLKIKKNTNNIKEIHQKTNCTIQNFCLECNKPVKNKYCNSICQNNFRWRNTKKQLENNSYPKNSPKILRRFLKEKYKNTCQKCGLSQWNEKPIPVEIEHIDGNFENNKIDNLTLLCCNCHAQTNTYKSRNKGNGRHFRMQRYKSEKSY